MGIQEVFQIHFRLFYIMGQIFYWARSAVKHLDPSIMLPSEKLTTEMMGGVYQT
jgi:hypothetical protein